MHCLPGFFAKVNSLQKLSTSEFAVAQWATLCLNRTICMGVGLEQTNLAGSAVSCRSGAFISYKVFIKSFCESKFPHKSVILFFVITYIKNKLTDLCGD